MPFKILDVGFDLSEFEASPLVQNPDISDAITRTLARLMGYDDTNRLWRALSLDERGVLSVDPFGTLSGGYTVTRLQVTATQSKLLNEDPTRKELIIVNNSDSGAVFYQSSDVSNSMLGIVPAYGELTRRGYTGPVWGAVYLGTGEIHFLERG